MAYNPHHSSPPLAGPASSPPTSAYSFYSPLGARHIDSSTMMENGASTREGSLTPTGPTPESLTEVRTSFVNDQDPNSSGSRYFQIVEYPNGNEVMAHALQVVDRLMKEAHLRRHFTTAVPLDTSNNIKMHFDSFRQAQVAAELFRVRNFKIEFITQEDFARTKFQSIQSINRREGEVQFTIRTTPAAPDAATELLDSVGYIAKAYGEILQVVQTRAQPVTTGGYLKHFDFDFVIEFDSVDAAVRILKGMPTQTFRYPSDMGTFEWTILNCVIPSGGAFGEPSTYMMRQPAPLMIPQQGRGDLDNQVQPQRIVDGHDIRTTIMLRNIPNRMDYQGLKQILDVYCFGKYDFIYLRIDFQTGHNVGYAFINFIDAASILDLMNSLRDIRWPGFASQRPAEISYATIQDKNNLIGKFQNSAVMTEASYVRPRIFVSYLDIERADRTMRFVGAHHLLGTEIRFPPPNNHAKLQRSMAAGRDAGLFLSNYAGHSAFDNRSRSDMYDNGNPRAARQAGWLKTDLEVQRAVEKAYSCFFQWTQFDKIPKTFVDGYIRCSEAARLSNQYSPAAGVIGQPSTNSSVACTPITMPFPGYHYHNQAQR